MTKELKDTINGRMVKGCSNYRIAREYNICEATIRYHIQRGALKRKVDADETTGSLPAKRKLPFKRLPVRF